MNRLFGSSKPKQPAPNLTDCISNVSLPLAPPEAPTLLPGSDCTASSQ